MDEWDIELCVFIKNGKVRIGYIAFAGQDPEDAYGKLFVIERWHPKDDDSGDVQAAKALAFDVALKAGLQLELYDD